ncbi:MAG: tetratricopeptide repeat protein [Pikeienuella sp.]
MSIMNSWLLSAALSVLLVFSASAQEASVLNTESENTEPGEEKHLSRDERLNLLFADLAVAPEEAQSAIADDVLGMLSDSGSPSANLLLARGRKALEDQRADEARAHLSALTRLAPDFAEGWNASATHHYIQGNYARAIADIQQALRVEPRHFGALAGLAIILERTERPESALATWREVAAIYPAFKGAKDAIERLSPDVEGRKI